MPSIRVIEQVAAGQTLALRIGRWQWKRVSERLHYLLESWKMGTHDVIQQTVTLGLCEYRKRRLKLGNHRFEPTGRSCKGTFAARCLASRTRRTS